jgi:hypothetical protein
MARSVATIQAQIIASIAGNSNMTYVDSNNNTQNLTNNTSHRALWLAWTYIIAVAISIFEQLLDVYQATIEGFVAQSAAASQLWLQAKMFQFQYSATNPQVIQLVNTVPVYPVVDPTLRIITACAVSQGSGSVNIKVAKGNTFVKLSSTENAAAAAYIGVIGDAGITYNVISLDPDLLYIDADIYCQGQYSSIIRTNVINAIVAFLQNLSVTNFDGALKMSDLEGVIRGVTGVNDVLMKKVSARPAAVSFGSGFQLINASTVVSRQYNSAAGYIIQETTSGSTFSDSLNFIFQ